MSAESRRTTASSNCPRAIWQTIEIGITGMKRHRLSNLADSAALCLPAFIFYCTLGPAHHEPAPSRWALPRAQGA